MPKIIINEADYTNPVVSNDITDIAYVPGFSINNPGESTYTLNEPQLFTSVADFEEKIGRTPYYFSNETISEYESGKNYSEYQVAIQESVYYTATGATQGITPGSNYTPWKESTINDWSAGEYDLFDVIKIAGTDKYYVSTVANNTTTPEEDGSNWERCSFKGFYSSETTYSKYDLVLNGTTYYLNLLLSNYGVPTNNSTLIWVAGKGDFASTTTYSKYENVSYNGAVYVSLTDNNEGNIPSTNTDMWLLVVSSGESELYGLDLEFDIAYVYAHELLKMGLPIYYEVIEAATKDKCTSVEQFYAALPNALDKYKDIGSYYLKYLTTGGYPILVDTSTTELIQKIAGVAATRGEAIALIDHVDGMPIVVEESDSPYAVINGLADSVFQIEGDTDHKDTGSYAAVTTPWQFYTFTTAYDANHENFKLKLAGSFAYLVSLAQSIKNNPNCLAIAGVQRAVVPFTNAETSQSPKITNAIANSYCSGTEYGDGKRSINGITNIRGNGLTIWGNRTLLKNPADRAVGAFGYLNIRNMVCDVKKVVYSACQELMFEQNNDILWINFKTKVTPLLDRLSTNGGIAGYKIVKQKCKNMAKLLATIILYPIYAVEEFEIGIEMRQEGISVVEQ